MQSHIQRPGQRCAVDGLLPSELPRRVDLPQRPRQPVLQQRLPGYHDGLGHQYSMSRKGNCWGNASTASFWVNLKVACLLAQRVTTRGRAKAALLMVLQLLPFAFGTGLSKPHTAPATLAGGLAQERRMTTPAKEGLHKPPGHVLGQGLNA